MPFKLTFLSASLPLTKTIELVAGTIVKSPYPLVANFTSHTSEISSLDEFYKLLLKYAVSPQKPCLIKGKLSQELVCSSRKGTTRTNDNTQWVCLDLDRAPFSSPEEVMRALSLDDVSYIAQYSSSYKLDKKDKTLSCHIFFLLSRPVAAPELKSWLMHLNMSVPVLEKALDLSNSASALRWPLDITTCQNDKLLYIAMPVFKGLASPLKESERIALFTKELPSLPVERLELKPIEQLKKKAKEKLNALRTAAGFSPIKPHTRMVGEYEVQGGVGEIASYEVIDCGEYNRLNLNGGDSQAYWHHKTDIQYLHNFKGEPSLLLKEVLPHYYADLIRNAKNTDATPSAQGDLLLAFRDKVTATYYKGTWNPEKQELDLDSVKSELQLDHFLQGHGRALGPFVPEWRMLFDPHSLVVVDDVAKVINTFQATEYMRNGKKNKKGEYPLIQRILDSCVGTGEIQEHFINWLAVCFQMRKKPLTAWALHGTEGCLAAETEISFRRGKRNAGRPLTIKEAYEKWNGLYKQGIGLGKAWDMSIPTYAHCVKDNGTVGYSDVFRIVESGVKRLYRVVTEDGGLIRVTHEHPFMRTDGSFTKLCDLSAGDYVLKRGEKNQHIVAKGRNKSRKTIHSIQYHPHAWQHIIDGKNYKRAHKARLVWEAALNGLSFEAFVHILRRDQPSAMRLQYLPPDVVVHHIDEDCTNDALDNLALVAKGNHDLYHAKSTGLGTVPTVPCKIVSITEDNEEMTYDMTMKAPYHNYVANEFCVSNTGKGLLFHRVLRPLFGQKHAIQKRASELNSQFNGWVEKALIVVIDEVDMDMFLNAKAVEADLRTLITEPPATIRKMRTDSYEVENYTAFIFASNKKRPINIPAGDRRFNVGVFQKQRLVISQSEIDSIKNEVEAFAHMLASYKANFELATTVLQTDDRAAIQRLSITSVDTLANELIEGNLIALWEAMPDENLANENGMVDMTASAYSGLVRYFSREKVSRITRDELGVIFRHCIGKVPEGAHKLTAFLAHHGLILKRFRLGNQFEQGIEVEWKVTKADREAIDNALKDSKQSRMKRVK